MTLPPGSTEFIRRRRVEQAVAALRSSVDRFIAQALSDEPTARMKMLETSIEVAPAMEGVVKAVTGMAP